MGKYDDIIDLPHHVSKVHPQMSIWDRSAQFAPFAALTGHEEAIAETARLTNEWHEPDEDKKSDDQKPCDAQARFDHDLCDIGFSCKDRDSHTDHIHPTAD